MKYSFNTRFSEKENAKSYFALASQW